jgi:hypothetical protein
MARWKTEIMKLQRLICISMKDGGIETDEDFLNLK